MTSLSLSSIISYHKLSLALNSPNYNSWDSIICRIENPQRFVIFKPEEVSFLIEHHSFIGHEIVPTDHPVCLFFDIDFRISRNRLWSYIKDILDDLITSLIPEIHRLEARCQIPIFMDQNSFCVLISIPENKGRVFKTPGLLEQCGLEDESIKAGIHIIVPTVVFENIKGLKQFVQEILPFLKNCDIYDCEVYKNNCSFRLPGCIKSTADPRILRTITAAEAKEYGLDNYQENPERNFTDFLLHPDPAITIICFSHMKTNYQLQREVERRHTIIHNVQLIYDHLVESQVIDDCFQPKKIKDNLIHLQRLRPGYCHLCLREHESENAWLAVWGLSKNYYIVIGCHRTNEVAKKDLPSHLVGLCENLDEKDDLELDILEPEEIMGCDVPPETDELSFEAEVQEWIKLVNSHDIQCLPTVDLTNIPEFYHTFVVSGMGTGKTKGVRDFLLAQCLLLPDLRILMITSRRTLSAKFFGDYMDLGFVLYSDIRGAICDNRIIVQVESLSRVILDNAFTIVILDEVISLFEQLVSPTDSSLSQLKSQALQYLCIILADASRVISLDAFFNAATFSTIQSFAPKQTHLIVNTFESNKNHSYYLTSSLETAISHLILSIGSLNEGEQIFVACEGRSFVTSLRDYLLKSFPTLDILLITGNISEHKKFQLFQDADQNLTSTVVMYTSVVSSGVSYTLPVKFTYGFTSGRLVHARTLLQMMGRARASKEWIICTPDKDMTLKKVRDWESMFRLTYLKMIRKPVFLYLNILGGHISMQTFRETYLSLCLLISTIRYQSQLNIPGEILQLLERYGGRISKLDLSVYHVETKSTAFKKS